MNFSNRPTLLIYRDLVRLIRTVMDPNKQISVLSMVRKEFDKNRKIKDNDDIMKLKKNACKSIGDLYLYYIKNSIKDDKSTIDKDKLL